MKIDSLPGFLFCFAYAAISLFCCAYLIIGSLFTGGALEKQGYSSVWPTVAAAVLTAILVMALYIHGVISSRKRGFMAFDTHLWMLSGIPAVIIFFGALSFLGFLG